MKYRIMQQHDLIWIEEYCNVGLIFHKMGWTALGSSIGSELHLFIRKRYDSVEAAEKQIQEWLDRDRETDLRMSSEARVIKTY